MKRYNACFRSCAIIEVPDGEFCKATEVAELEQQLADEKENCQGASECLYMVKECLEQLGKDMSAVPPMFYPEAIVATLREKLKEAGV